MLIRHEMDSGDSHVSKKIRDFWRLAGPRMMIDCQFKVSPFPPQKKERLFGIFLVIQFFFNYAYSSSQFQLTTGGWNTCHFVGGIGAKNPSQNKNPIGNDVDSISGNV